TDDGTQPASPRAPGSRTAAAPRGRRRSLRPQPARPGPADGDLVLARLAGARGPPLGRVVRGGGAAADARRGAMSEAAIELVEMTNRFKDFLAVEALSLEVRTGEIFGLVGPNGSGKTTTVNVISGLSRPTSGEVRVLGRDMLSEPRSVRRLLGSVPQETALYEELSAETNLRFHADLFDVPRSLLDERMDRLLDLVQLEDRRRDRVGNFSGGMKRRLALARALLHDPQMLYLDEPTLGVDVQARRAIWDYILSLRDEGKTVLITTNYLEEAQVLCERVAIIDQGKLI